MGRMYEAPGNSRAGPNAEIVNRKARLELTRYISKRMGPWAVSLVCTRCKFTVFEYLAESKISKF